MEPSREHPHVPGPSLWPVGFAIGVVVLLVGVVVSWLIIAIGAAIALVFGLLWVRDVATGGGLAESPAVEPETRETRAAPAEPPPTVPPAPAQTEQYSRSAFLEASTLGLGAVIGGLVTLPALGFMVAPAFLKQNVEPQDIGPLSDFPEGEFIVATFLSNPPEGKVSRRTAFVRYNGPLGREPSFTIISNRCSHVGCPTEPNGQLFPKQTKHYSEVRLVPTKPSGFGCPCHGSQFDLEGNRTAGPAVRALDRYSFSIKNGHLFLGAPFSVSHVEGTGATAKIQRYTWSFPGEHVDGIESWLYPIQPPHPE